MKSINDEQYSEVSSHGNLRKTLSDFTNNILSHRKYLHLVLYRSGENELTGVEEKIGPFHYDVSNILECLSGQFQAECKYTDQSISFTMTIFEELRLVCILRFGLIKAVFNARPPKPKHTLTWDGDDPFSTYHKISEKLTFLAPYKHSHVCLSGDKKCWFFGKFCERTKWMNPCTESSKFSKRQSDNDQTSDEEFPLKLCYWH